MIRKDFRFSYLHKKSNFWMYFPSILKRSYLSIKYLESIYNKSKANKLYHLLYAKAIATVTKTKKKMQKPTYL